MWYPYVMALPAEMQRQPERVSVAEYLAREAKAEQKHEFHDGEVLAMSGGTLRHSRINANLVGEVRDRLKGSPCFVLDSNMRVAIAATRRYFYPDATIVCGEPRFDENDPNQTTIVNPRVIVETLSASTEAYDRGEKFTHYRHLESLREYVLISQDRPAVETFLRRDDGTWTFSSWEGVAAVARLWSLEIDLPLAEVFAGITFEGVTP